MGVESGKGDEISGTYANQTVRRRRLRRISVRKSSRHEFRSLDSLLRVPAARARARERIPSDSRNRKSGRDRCSGREAERERRFAEIGG